MRVAGPAAGPRRTERDCARRTDPRSPAASVPRARAHCVAPKSKTGCLDAAALLRHSGDRNMSVFHIVDAIHSDRVQRRAGSIGATGSQGCFMLRLVGMALALLLLAPSIAGAQGANEEKRI